MPETQNQPTEQSTTPTVEDLQKELETWKGHSRTWEQRSKANQAAADELEAVKTDLATKTTELDELKTAKAELEPKVTSYKVALEYGLSVDDTELLTGDEESMRKLAARIAPQSNGPRSPEPNPAQGKDKKPAPTTSRDQFISLFEG